MKRCFFFLLLVLVSFSAWAQINSVDYTIQNGNVRLPATLTLVDNSKQKPLLVLVHGSGPNDRDETIGPNKFFKQFSEKLAARGISTLRYDKRTLLYKAGADTITYMEESVSDAVQAVKQLKSEGYERIFVAGHSLGGHVAPLIAQDAKGMIEGLILLAGNVSKLKSTLESQLKYIGEKQGMSASQISMYLQHMLGTLPVKYLQFDEAYDAIKTSKSVVVEQPELRWLVVQGGHDYQVGTTDFLMWKIALADKATYYYNETLDHLLRPLPAMATPDSYMQPGEISNEVVETIANFTK